MYADKHKKFMLEIWTSHSNNTTVAIIMVQSIILTPAQPCQKTLDSMEEAWE